MPCRHPGVGDRREARTVPDGPSTAAPSRASPGECRALASTHGGSPSPLHDDGVKTPRGGRSGARMYKAVYTHSCGDDARTPICPLLAHWEDRTGPNRAQQGRSRDFPGEALTRAKALVRPSELGAPSAGFEPAHTAPEADALSPELRGRGPPGLQASGGCHHGGLAFAGQGVWLRRSSVSRRCCRAWHSSTGRPGAPSRRRSSPSPRRGSGCGRRARRRARNRPRPVRCQRWPTPRSP